MLKFKLAFRFRSVNVNGTVYRDKHELSESVSAHGKRLKAFMER
jgi:hypothetical protein